MVSSRTAPHCGQVRTDCNFRSAGVTGPPVRAQVHKVRPAPPESVRQISFFTPCESKPLRAPSCPVDRAKGPLAWKESDMLYVKNVPPAERVIRVLMGI